MGDCPICSPLRSRVVVYEHMFRRAIAAFELLGDLLDDGPIKSLANNAAEQAAADLATISLQDAWLEKQNEKENSHEQG